MIRALVSNEASSFRQQLCKAVAEILYKWISGVLEKGLNLPTLTSPQVSSPTNEEYESLLRDRRLRVIFFKSFNSARRDPLLLFRFCCSSFSILFVASAMALRRVLAALFTAYSSRVSYDSKQIATAT